MVKITKDQLGNLQAEVCVYRFNIFQKHAEQAGVLLRTVTKHLRYRSDNVFVEHPEDAHEIIDTDQIVTGYFTVNEKEIGYRLKKYASSIISVSGHGRIKSEYIIHRPGLEWLKKARLSPPPSEEQVLMELLSSELWDF